MRQAATRGTVQYRYVPPKTPPSPGPATRSPGGPLRGRSAAPPGQPGVHPPQSYFSASTTGKNQYVRPRAPCTSAPPHADGGKWGGLDLDVFSRAAAARCLGSSEGCPARPVVSLRVDGRPIPTAIRHRHVLERLWSERGGRRPPWDLLRLPAPRRICTVGAAPPWTGRAPRRPAAACRWSTGRPVASRSVDGRSFPAARCSAHSPGRACTGRGGRGRRGAPPGAPRPRSPAPRGAAGPSRAISLFERRPAPLRVPHTKHSYIFPIQNTPILPQGFPSSCSRQNGHRA